MGERQSPKSQVGGCVRDSIEDELDGFDQLVDHNLQERVFLLLCRLTALKSCTLNKQLLELGWSHLEAFPEGVCCNVAGELLLVKSSGPRAPVIFFLVVLLPHQAALSLPSVGP